MRLLDGGKWTHSSATQIGIVLKAHGYEGPEARAREAEENSRHEGAIRAMQVLENDALLGRSFLSRAIKFEQR